MSLAALQRDFRDWLVAGEEAAAARIGEGPGLAVYRNNYRAQLRSCLADAYARVKLWLGDEAFEAAAEAQISRVQPTSWSLDHYGADFPALLTELHPDDPEVAELAWIDLAMEEAFIGPDAVALGLADLAGVDWDDAVIGLAPTLRVRQAKTNAGNIWLALSAEETPPGVWREEAILFVWRQGFVARVRVVDAVEACALDAARSGRSFGEICADLASRFGDEAGVVAAARVLGRWIGDGLIVSVRAQAD